MAYAYMVRDEDDEDELQDATDEDPTDERSDEDSLVENDPWQ